MRVSIAMATYNGAEYLQEQLDSFLTQTRLPDELIVCDDCSTDHTIEVLRAFPDRAPFRVRILKNETRIGFIRNFERALSLCGGELVFLSDQDDIWLPKKISTIERAFEQDPATQLIIHDVEYRTADLAPIGQTAIERGRIAKTLNHTYILGMATAVRRPFVELCLPIPVEFGIAHDSWLHKCAGALDRKTILPDILALYRRHASNTSDTDMTASRILTRDYYRKKNNDLLKKKMTTRTTYFPDTLDPVTTWLMEAKGILRKEGLASADKLDEKLREGFSRFKSGIARNNIRRMPRYKRLSYILTLMAKGGYGHFSGWQSAIKDLIFP